MNDSIGGDNTDSMLIKNSEKGIVVGGLGERILLGIQEVGVSNHRIINRIECSKRRKNSWINYSLLWMKNNTKRERMDEFDLSFLNG